MGVETLAELMRRAQEALRGSRPADAVPLLRQAVTVAPYAVEAHYLLGVALVQVQQPAAAAAALDRTLSLHPRHSGALYARAVLFHRSGDTASARRCLEQLLEIDPGNQQARAALDRLPPVERPAEPSPAPAAVDLLAGTSFSAESEPEAASTGEPTQRFAALQEEPTRQLPALDADGSVPPPPEGISCPYPEMESSEAQALLAAAGITDPADMIRALAADDDVATAAATVLGRSGHRPAIEALLAVLWRARVRRHCTPAGAAACMALGTLGGSRAVKELAEMTQLPWFGGAAAAGLQRLMELNAHLLESPDLSRVVGLGRITQEVVGANGPVRMEVDRAPLRALARAELQRRAAARPVPSDG